MLDGSKLYTRAEYEQIQHAEYQTDHYDLLQLTKKIQLNSAYGSLLNVAFRFGRREVGASVTGCGRQISLFMNESIGTLVSGKQCIIEKRYAPSKATTDDSGRTVYKNIVSSDDIAAYRKEKKWDKLREFPARAGEMMMHKGKMYPCYGAFYFSETDECIYGDTDSQPGSTMVRTSEGDLSFEELFEEASVVKTVDDGRQFAFFAKPLYTLSYDPSSDTISMLQVSKLYRHKVSKKKYTIILANGKTTSVTADHSLMVERSGLIEIKPIELQDGDIFITANDMNIERTTISKVEISDFEDEFVYDFVMKDSSRPYYFGDDILVHNSCYFGTNATNYEDAVIIADEVANTVNDLFPNFMVENFNCTGGRQDLIKVAREVVAESGLFLYAKKKYTLKVVNMEGADLRDHPKLKSMGSEIKKADTPKVIQDFLKRMMDLILDKRPYAEIEELVNGSRGTLIKNSLDVLSLGGSKQINNLDALYANWKLVERNGKGKLNLPGHVRAAINYNELIIKYEQGAKLISSGDKGVVFYLLPNPENIKSIAFPSDLMHLPTWFTENFQIDMKLTEQKLIDSKIEGIFEAIGIEKPTIQGSYINSVFSF